MSNINSFTPLTELLKDIIDNRGKSVPTSASGFPLIATNCIKTSSIFPTFENIRFVSEEVLNTWFRSHLKTNDILFVNKGTPGRTCLTPEPVSFCIAQDMMGLRIDEKKISYRYVFALLRSDFIQKSISNYHVGLVIPHFKKSDLKTILIPRKRTREEEDLIGNIYLELSEKIELNNQINNELESLTKSIYNYWFAQFDFPNKQNKPYQQSNGEMKWSDTLKKNIPEKWKVGSASDILTFNPSLTLKKGSISSYIDMNALPLKGFMTHLPQRKQYNGGIKFQNGDVVVARITPCLENGKTGLISLLEKDEVGFGSTEFIVLRGKHQKLSSYAACFSRSDLFRKYAIANMTGTSGRKRVDYKTLESFPMAIPPSDLLEKFENLTHSFFEKETICTKENQQLQELRDWLLPLLINGQVKIEG